MSNGNGINSFSEDHKQASQNLTEPNSGQLISETNLGQISQYSDKWGKLTVEAIDADRTGPLPSLAKCIDEPELRHNKQDIIGFAGAEIRRAPFDATALAKDP